MKIWDYFKKRNINKETVTNDDFIANLLNQKMSIAFSCYGGWNVLETPTLLSCLNKIVSNVSQTPLNIYLKTKDGKEKDTTSNLAYVLRSRPNGSMTPSIFKKFIVNQLLIFGECFASIIRNKNGEVIAIAPLKRGTISYTIDSFKGDFYYKYYLNQKNMTVSEKQDLLHFKDNLNGDGSSMSVITKLSSTIGMDKGMTQFLQEYLSNMVNPSFVLEVDSDISTERAKVISKTFSKEIAGTQGAPLVIQKGLKAKEFNAKSLKDLDITLMRNQSVRDIVTALNCPLHTVGLEIFNREAETSFFENVIIPILINIEEELNYKLFSKKELNTRFIKFSTKEKLRGNMQERINYYTELFRIGAITQNEIRAIEDMNKVEDGDEPLILENYLPTKHLDKQKKLENTNEQKNESK